MNTEEEDLCLQAHQCKLIAKESKMSKVTVYYTQV